MLISVYQRSFEMSQTFNSDLSHVSLFLIAGNGEYKPNGESNSVGHTGQFFEPIQGSKMKMYGALKLYLYIYY